jgi:ribonuclease H2 subunit A
MRPEPCDVFGSGPLLISDIPLVIRNNNDKGVIMGIDEAGRGPVLGPMTYAAAFWNPDDAESVPRGFNDSKQLTPEKRASLFEQILSSESIGFVLRVLHASEISRNMLRRAPYNLNAMSHDAAIEMIWAVLNAGVRIDTWYVCLGCFFRYLIICAICFFAHAQTQLPLFPAYYLSYIDTVGIADTYTRMLERVFEGKGITFVVEKKADAKYTPCSAASVVAKESRDSIITNWKWTEGPKYETKNSNEFGSGYPSDPKCKAWLDSNCNVDVPFGFPDVVRFSWAPAKNALKCGGGKSGSVVQWEADDDEDDESGGKQSSMDCFVVSKKGGNMEERRRKKPRLDIFNVLGLAKVTKFVDAA